MNTREEMIRHLDTMELRPSESRKEVEEMNETKCEECGAPVEDDHYICYWCAQRGQEVEDRINEMIDWAVNDERQRQLEL